MVVTLAICGPAHAYVDPGIGGMLLQLGYVLFYGLIGCLAFLGKPFAFLFGKKKTEEDEEESDEEEHDDQESSKEPAKTGTEENEPQAKSS